MKPRIVLFAILTTALLGGAAPSGGDASGCSWYSGSPGYGGCRSGSGSCYECDYNRGGAQTRCWENGDGSVAFCIDHQDI
jgi:hypothetical protein